MDRREGEGGGEKGGGIKTHGTERERKKRGGIQWATGDLAGFPNEFFLGGSAMVQPEILWESLLLRPAIFFPLYCLPRSRRVC